MNSYEREYDKHRNLVSYFCQYFSSSILHRGETHDYSKITQPERETFESFQLQDTDYGTKEYDERLLEMKEGLKYHYRNNRHHPEHFENGIEGMNLVDIVEMLSDWLAAVEKHKSSNVFESLLICKERFQISDDLYNIFLNTVKDLQSKGKLKVDESKTRYYSRISELSGK